VIGVVSGDVAGLCGKGGAYLCLPHCMGLLKSLNLQKDKVVSKNNEKKLTS
jgi:hypothetical protein